MQDQFVTIFNAISATATVASETITVFDSIIQGSIMITTDSGFLGTTGTFVLQASNDNINYATVTQDDNTTAMSYTVSNGANSYVMQLKRILFKYYKVVYTKGDASAGIIVGNFIGKK